MKTESYISKIIEETGLSKKDIQDMVEEKKKELKGLISEEGALFIIAKELGVDVREENKDLIKDIDINIADITPHMKNISLIGRIKEINQINTFNKKDGGEGRVGSFSMNDPTGDIRIVLWDDDVNMLAQDNFVVNELVKIFNGYAKEGKYGTEIHLGRIGKIQLSPEDADYTKYPKSKHEIIEIKDVSLSLKSISIEGKIMSKFPIKEFTKKSGDVGKVGTLNIRDTTASIRVTFWNEDTDKIKDFNQGDYVSISNLNPRLSNLDNTTIDLFGNRNTIIKKQNKELKIQGNQIEEIKDLEGQTNSIVTFQGIISSIEDLRKVNLKSGEEASVLGFDVGDETAAIKVTLWKENAEEYSEILNVGTGILLKNVLVRYNKFSSRNEISFIKESSIELIDLKIENIKNIQSAKREPIEGFTNEYTKIKQINSQGNFEIKGFIAKPLENITIYEACTKCHKKLMNCKCDNRENTEHRMILNITIDDGTGSIRSTLFQEVAEKLVGIKTDSIVKIKDTPNFPDFLDNLNSTILGKDIILKGRAKYSDFSSTYELSAQNFQDMNVDEELEKVMREIET